MKITCDLQLTLMASSLYRLLGAQVGRGYEEAKGRHIFRDFIDAVGLITLTDMRLLSSIRSALIIPTDCSGLCQYRCVSALVGRKRLLVR